MKDQWRTSVPKSCGSQTFFPKAKKKKKKKKKKKSANSGVKVQDRVFWTGP